MPTGSDSLTTGANVRAAASAILASGRHETARTTWRLCLGDLLQVSPSCPMDSRTSCSGMCTRRRRRRRSGRSRRSSCCGAYAAIARRCTRTAHRRRRDPAFLLGGFAVGVGARTGARDETTVAASRVVDLEKPLGASYLERLARSSVPFPNDVPNDATARADALALVRACPQFAVDAGEMRGASACAGDLTPAAARGGPAAKPGNTSEISLREARDVASNTRVVCSGEVEGNSQSPPASRRRSLGVVARGFTRREYRARRCEIESAADGA